MIYLDLQCWHPDGYTDRHYATGLRKKGVIFISAERSPVLTHSQTPVPRPRRLARHRR